jgi:uncharacterized membrane protein
MSAAAGVFAVVMLLGWFFYWSARMKRLSKDGSRSSAEARISRQDAKGD